MQVMFVSHAAISTNVLMNPETLGHQVGSIFATNNLWLENILRRILVCTNKFYGLIYKMFFIRKLIPTLNVQLDSIHTKAFNKFFF